MRGETKYTFEYSDQGSWTVYKAQPSAEKRDEAMAKLPYEQKEVVILRIQGEVKFKEIAKLQDVSIKTIQSRYRYGLEKIRTILNSEMGK